jgi:hypothetical protein
METVNLNRQVFNKQKFNDTVDTTFSELGVQQQDPSFFDLNLATVDDFFTLYNRLFFEIPKEGAINSHTFLIKESGDYVGSQQVNEEIQALLQEITDLREENLALRVENTKLIVGNPNSNALDTSDQFNTTLQNLQG